MSVMTKEEHARNQRRRARQAFGALLLVLILIGLVAVIRGGVSLVGGLFDDTAKRESYAKKLEGMVMFDPLPFRGLQDIDDTTLREAAVWGTVYSILDTENGLDGYARDPDTDMVLLPSVEVDAYLAKLVGPTFKLDHKSFDMEDMTIVYDETTQCYMIPVTSSVGSYSPVVTKLTKKGGKLLVTVGYLRNEDEFDLSAANSDSNVPVKYMDYIFERSNGGWYLTGLQESETKAETAASSAASDSAAAAGSDVESAILAGGGAASDSTASSAAAGSEASASASADAAA